MLSNLVAFASSVLSLFLCFFYLFVINGKAMELSWQEVVFRLPIFGCRQ